MKKRLFGLVMCLVLMFAVIPVASATSPAIGLNESKIVWQADGVVSYEFTAPESKVYTFKLQKILPVSMTTSLKLYDQQNQLLASSVTNGVSIIPLSLTAGEVVRINASTSFKAGLIVY